jgi:outer membrane protein assembly factor BamD
MPVTATTRQLLSAAALLALVGFTGACASSGAITPPSATEQEADNFLFTNGTEALNNERWLTAREYFRRLVDTYPTSRFRQDAKLGIGDSYLGERRIDSDILAAGEFREFLRFYPLAERADYAQYRLAVSQFRQMLGPQRDQTATRDALRELQVFTTNYPNSKYLPEVAALERQVRDRLSESEFLVGRHYYRTRWYPGAVTRLEAVLKNDPQYTGRDGVYFYLAESYAKQQRYQDARTHYQKVIDEFAVSEYLEDAAERIRDLAKLEAAAPPVADTTGTPAPGAPAPQDPALPAATPAAPAAPATR